MLNTNSLRNQARTVLFLGLTGISFLSFAQDNISQNEISLGSGDLGMSGAFMSFIGIFFLLLWVSIFALVILWILMLIHAAKHDIQNKTTWIILMCLIGFPVSVIYFFTERKRFNKTHIVSISPINTVVTTPQPTPTQPINIV